MSCGEIQDLLPDRAAGRLEPTRVEAIDGHLADCPDCSAVFEAVRGLAATRPTVPAGLEARILAAVRNAGADEVVLAPTRRRWRFTPVWGLAAAAVLALAIGLPVVSNSDSGEDPEVGVLALAEEGVAGVWLDDDLMIAGAPAVSELSDEALATLLEELER